MAAVEQGVRQVENVHLSIIVAGTSCFISRVPSCLTFKIQFHSIISLNCVKCFITLKITYYYILVVAPYLAQRSKRISLQCEPLAIREGSNNNPSFKKFSIIWLRLLDDCFSISRKLELFSKKKQTS